MAQTLRFLALSALFAVGLTACGGSGGGSTPTSPTTPQVPTYAITDFITGVRWVNGTDAVQGAAVPSPSGSLSVTPTTSAGVINGGSRVVRIQASAPITTIYVTVRDVDRALAGVWVLTLGSGTSDTYIVVTFSTNLPTTTFTMSISVATSSGQVSSAAGVATSVLNAGTGQVQVSVTWDSASDVDLHVVDPSGERIYWANRTSASGGQLDLDSNAGCSIDNVNNENIKWTTAPNGTYTVAVDYWSSCGVGATQYVVTINNGGTQSVFTGTFTGTDTDEPRVISSFSRGTTSMRTMETPLEHLRVLAERMRAKGGY
jgi:hypothetical protein